MQPESWSAVTDRAPPEPRPPVTLSLPPDFVPADLAALTSMLVFPFRQFMSITITGRTDGSLRIRAEDVSRVRLLKSPA
jgi:hypothetical protein